MDGFRGNLPDAIPAEHQEGKAAGVNSPSDVNGSTKRNYANPSDVGQKAEAITDRQQDPRMPKRDPGNLDPARFATATEYLDQVALTHDLGPSQMFNELVTWRLFCSRTRTPKGVIYPEYDSVQYSEIIDKFEHYCSGINEAAESKDSGLSVEELRSRLTGNLPKSVFDDLDTMNHDLALDIIMRELESALDRLSVPRTQVVIGETITNSIYPGVEERGMNSWGNLIRSAFPTAFTLVCDRLDGCIGVDHPFIVAYCLEKNATSHRLCNLPSSMSEAIYQTLTPVEHQQYLALLNWIDAELSRYRATTGGR